MAWEHKIAKAIKQNKGASGLMWFEGQVLSPHRTESETGEPEYTGPLIVSAMGGEIILREDRLRELDTPVRAYAGCRVALLGALFSHDPGSQSVLVLGVIR